MEKLSVEDGAKGMADAVKASGASSFAASDLMGELKSAITSSGKDKAAARAAACEAVAAITEGLGEAGEPYGAEFLPLLLACCADKVKPTQDAAAAAATKVVGALCTHATKHVMPAILGGLDKAAKWQTMVCALGCITILAEEAPKQVAQCMADIVPLLQGLLNDSKKQVKEGARKALEACAECVKNADIEKLLPRVITAMSDINERPETVYDLASTTFVQTVETAALAILAPLLNYGIRERVTKLRRQSSVIINNMSKLVEDPAEAAPFIPTLLPLLETASKEVSDPEAREVCDRARAQIQRIADHYAKVGDRKAKPEKVLKVLAEHVPEVDELTKKFVASIVCSLVDCKCLEEAEWETSIAPYVAAAPADKAKAAVKVILEECIKDIALEDEESEDETGEELCNCQFTLAYGNKILLHNTKMRLKRGAKYGLLGGNDSGKTTLMRSIANGQVEGFPDPTEVRTVFVEADIKEELSALSCLDYIYEDPVIKKYNIPREKIQAALERVGYSGGPGIACYNNGVSTLSGGWRMKLALARAMLQEADILLMDEPTNHLDVINVAWVKDYLNSLNDVTCIMVSHDKGLLNDVCTNILAIKNLKLHQTKGNLDVYVKDHPEAMSFFDMKKSKQKFTFPQPSKIKGVNTKGKFLMKMDNCTFTYPGNEKPTIRDITVRVSLGSRVACVGVNGAGKSTMIKLLTGELVPQVGDVWKHPSCRVAYVAQHAFHHIEKHLKKTPNEYIRWRYENGDDKEVLVKESMQLTPEEEKKCKAQIEIPFEDQDGKVTKVKRVIERLTGSRKELKGSKEYNYECQFVGQSMDSNLFVGQKLLEQNGFEKHIKAVDEKIAAREGMYVKPLTSLNVEKHIEDVGLEKDYATHSRMEALSGGQKVKVVLAAAMWMQPHILILDEPTNYLDRDSLGALAGAIEEFDGGVVMITHNNEFCSALCPETWLLEGGTLDCQGDAAWMENVMKEKVADTEQMDTMIDGLGNEVKIKKQKDKKMSRKEIKAMAKVRKAKLERGEELSDDEDWDLDVYIGAVKGKGDKKK